MSQTTFEITITSIADRTTETTVVTVTNTRSQERPETTTATRTRDIIDTTSQQSTGTARAIDPSPSGHNSASNTGIIAGAVVGSVVGFLLIAFASWMGLRVRKRRRAEGNTSGFRDVIKAIPRPEVFIVWTRSSPETPQPPERTVSSNRSKNTPELDGRSRSELPAPMRKAGGEEDVQIRHEMP